MRLPILALALVLPAAVLASAQVAGGEAPLASAGADQRVECASPAGASVTLDGAGSHAGENDTLTAYRWMAGENLVATGPTPTVTLPLGRHELRLEVWNATGPVGNDTVVVEVVDTTAPTLTVAPSVSTIAARGHRLTTVDFAVVASDACGPAGFVLSSVASDEPANGRGDGNTAVDIVGADVGTPDTSMQVRAERAGPGDGRAYTVTYRATDASGNAREVAAVIAVPHG